MLNGCSGALDIIPDELANFLRHSIHASPHGEASIELGTLHPTTLAKFIERGHLTKLNHTQEQEVVREIGLGMHELMADKPSLMIVPNMDCNYRCTYCFERPIQKKLKSDVSNISYTKGTVVMRRELVPHVYEAMEQLQTQANQQRGGMIILYGGEPLDAGNLDLVLDIIYSGVEKGYSFAAISNGHDLDKYLAVIREDMLNQIQVSIDGPRHVHDKRRIYRGKGSSFDKILANINTVLSMGGAQMQIRVHVDPSNISLFEETLALFEQEGWVNHPNAVIYSNTVYDKDQEGKVCVNMEVGEIGCKLNEITSRYNNVYTSAPAVHTSRALLSAFRESERFALKGTYCSANTGNFIFAPDGNLYACWESIGKDCSKIGSYGGAEGLSLDPAAVKRWFGRSVATIPECMECAFALVCGGGCAQYAEYTTGSLYKPYCDDFQRSFRTTLAEQVATFQTGSIKTPIEMPSRANGVTR
jgi:uncharacterized protein